MLNKEDSKNIEDGVEMLMYLLGEFGLTDGWKAIDLKSAIEIIEESGKATPKKENIIQIEDHLNKNKMEKANYNNSNKESS